MKGGSNLFWRKITQALTQGYREEIRRIALYLQAEQVALTQRHIARYLAQPAILRDPKVRGLLREVCQEIQEHRVFRSEGVK